MDGPWGHYHAKSENVKLGEIENRMLLVRGKGRGKWSNAVKGNKLPVMKWQYTYSAIVNNSVLHTWNFPEGINIKSSQHHKRVILWGNGGN